MRRETLASPMASYGWPHQNPHLGVDKEFLDFPTDL